MRPAPTFRLPEHRTHRTRADRASEQAHHARVHIDEESLDAALSGRSGALERKLSGGCPVKPAVEAEQVKVDVEVEAAAVALHEGDRSGLPASVSTLARKPSKPLAQRSARARWTAVQSDWS